MNLIKNVRLIILAALLLASAFFLIKPLLSKSFGVVVVSVENDSKCFLNEGSVITQVGGNNVADSTDFKNAENHFT